MTIDLCAGYIPLIKSHMKGWYRSFGHVARYLGSFVSNPSRKFYKEKNCLYIARKRN